MLIVDDDDAIVSLIQDAVTAMGHVPTAVTDPLQAFSLFVSGSYDLVITDFLMAPIDGMTLAIKMRTVDRPTGPERRVKTPILMITGTDGIDAFNARMAYPIQRIMMKPFRLHQLEEAVSALTNRKSHGASN